MMGSQLPVNRVTPLSLSESPYGQEALEIEIVSTLTPGAATASSVPIRKRNVTVCPARFGPRLIAVSM